MLSSFLCIFVCRVIIIIVIVVVIISTSSTIIVYNALASKQPEYLGEGKKAVILQLSDPDPNCRFLSCSLFLLLRPGVALLL